MNILDQELSTLRPSKPIFKLVLETRYSGESQNVNFKPLNSGRYSGNENSPIGKLVKSHYYESFSEGRFQVDIKSMRSRCIQAVKEELVVFLQNHSPQKNPTKTEMYRWFDRAAFGTSFKESFITTCLNLYVYKKNKGDLMDIPGFYNALSLLYNKHRNDFPMEYARVMEPTRRRRRRRW
jgi:hypothetical protein